MERSSEQFIRFFIQLTFYCLLRSCPNKIIPTNIWQWHNACCPVGPLTLLQYFSQGHVNHYRVRERYRYWRSCRCERDTMKSWSISRSREWEWWAEYLYPTRHENPHLHFDYGFFYQFSFFTISKFFFHTFSLKHLTSQRKRYINKFYSKAKHWGYRS